MQDGLFNGASLAQIVSHDHGATHAAQGTRALLGLGTTRLAAQPPLLDHAPATRILHATHGFFAPVVAIARAAPQGPGYGRHGCRDGAFDADRIVQSRPRLPAMMGVEMVIDEVDAADEADLSVHDRDLHVHAPPLAWTHPAQPCRHGPVGGQSDAVLDQALPQACRHVCRAQSIDHQVHRHATLGRTTERAQDLATLAQRRQEVNRQPDFALSRIDARDHLGKQGAPALVQAQLVAIEEPGLRLRVPAHLSQVGGGAKVRCTGLLGWRGAIHGGYPAVRARTSVGALEVDHQWQMV